MSGLTLQANYSTSWAGTEGGLNVGLPNVAGNDGKGNAMNLRADYANGPLTAGLSYWNAKGEDQQATVARTGQRANTIAVGYNLGVAKIGLTYDVSAVRAAAANVAAFTDTKRTAYSIPVVVPMGAGAVLFTYTSAGNSKTAGTTNVDTSATMVSVGYDHSLSKRTSLGVSYAKVDNKANAAYNPFVYSALTGSGAVGAGQDTAQLYLGLRHTFQFNAGASQLRFKRTKNPPWQHGGFFYMRPLKSSQQGMAPRRSRCCTCKDVTRGEPSRASPRGLSMQKRCLYV
jgi:predicted porin